MLIKTRRKMVHLMVHNKGIDPSITIILANPSFNHVKIFVDLVTTLEKFLKLIKIEQKGQNNRVPSFLASDQRA